MRTTVLFSALLVLLAACKGEKKSEGGGETETAAAPTEPAAPTADEIAAAEEAAAAAEEAAEAAELPSDPKELELARKTAILEGRTADAVKLCNAEDMGKLDEQAVLSCVLSACRESDREKAREWGALLKGPLKKQAQDVCKASNVAI